MVWKLDTHEGEKLYYEAELIDAIEKLCLKNIQDNMSGLQDICIACMRGKANMALTILDLIKEWER